VHRLQRDEQEGHEPELEAEPPRAAGAPSPPGHQGQAGGQSDGQQGVLRGDEAAQRPARLELVALAPAAGGQDAGLGVEQQDRPQDEGGEVDRLQRGFDQAAGAPVLRSAPP